MITFSCWLDTAQTTLTGSDSARLDAEILLGHVLQKDRAYLYTWPEQLLTGDQKQMADMLLERRANGEPIAYITGTKDFWSLSLGVTSDVLIPRPETELLVELALSKVDSCRGKVIDLGTGSGAIILSLAKELPGWQCWACDQSEVALKVAVQNGIETNLQGVQFICSDWFSNITERGFDMIISNPPYIDVKDGHLDCGDVRFEPRSALVAEQGGLADIKKIAQQSLLYLQKGGWLLLEHGFSQGGAVRELLTNQGYDEVETYRDLAGLERVTVGRLLEQAL